VIDEDSVSRLASLVFTWKQFSIMGVDSKVKATGELEEKEKQYSLRYVDSARTQSMLLRSTSMFSSDSMIQYLTTTLRLI